MEGMATSLDLNSYRLLILLCVFAVVPSLHADPDQGLARRQAFTTPPLVTFQVQDPILVPTPNGNQSGCVHTQLLMDNVFAFSYGKPFVGDYVPPPCDFNRVIINFTVTSRGRQFDRLGLMYLGDVEVFRTSTAEPTSNGTVWTYIKEMDQYDSLWKKEQKVIFDLGNLIDNTYTASFNTTLTATFFTVPNTKPAADQILPISARRSADDAPSAFSLPGDDASVAYTIPQNTERAVVSLLACGQATEEFWYTNVKNSEVDTFAGQIGELYGYSPLREVQLLIDGQLAGAFVPPTVIFTGGIVPGLWRPIVGLDAFDLTETEIDVTPWLPLLCDGASHTFEIRVAGLNDNGAGSASLSNSVGSSWIVTGKIFLFLGPQGSVTSGTLPALDASPPEITITSQVTTNSTGANETLRYVTNYHRSISVSSTIKTSNGTTFPTFWNQDFSFTNTNNISSQGFSQHTNQITKSIDTSSSGYTKDYELHLDVNSTFSTGPLNTISINGLVSRDVITLAQLGPTVFPSPLQQFAPGPPNPRNLYLYARPGRPDPYPLLIPPSLPTFRGRYQWNGQAGAASFSNSPNGSRSTGETDQVFRLKGLHTGGEASGGTEFYETYVQAGNSNLVVQSESLIGRPVGRQGPVSAALSGDEPDLQTQDAVARSSVREVLGRGPGKARRSLVGTREGEGVSVKSE
ncbi:MAG: hypothetical protein Q9169_003700 [Polycauliona sp. 2 TL-2023]